jgi:signal transduction histidine kinase/response regulator of citrate/malate metabolism
VIDDNPSIHADVRKVLCPTVSEATLSLEALEAELLGSPAAETAVRPAHAFVVDSALQGRDGLAMVQKALAEKQPYAMAFVDVRMPPGWDGVETTCELWKVAPDLQIVICTAYSDYSWEEIFAKIGGSDRLLILKKPFDTIEVLQLANAVTEKWNLLQQSRAHAAELELRVRARTTDLEAANATLQDEIGRRVLIEFDLKRAKDAAECADRAKSAFLANMSHEIRTPMNGVLGMANLLLGTSLNSEQRDLVQTLCQSGESLLTIINDILDFSKIEAGRLELESIEFDLTEHLGLALDLHVPNAAQKGLELIAIVDPAVPAHICGDPGRLRQIVLNLVGNAIKFTAAGEVVLNVTVDQASSSHALLRFSVTDTGIGIPVWVQEKLFQPFVQADNSTTRRFGGTGLGLVICKRLAELMGGEIGVKSTPEKGSTFWFTARFQCAEPVVAPVAPASSSLDGRRLLIVDDNATNRKLLTHLCALWNARHCSVDSADEALRQLRHAAGEGKPFDLVVTDHHMPDRDGLDLAAAIRADASLSGPPVVLLTSRGERLSHEQMDAHHIAACELKPVHAEKLRTALAQVLGAHSTGPDVGPAISPAAAKSQLETETAIILVAEDNLVNQKVTRLQLRNFGYAADVVTNGLEALAALRRKPYALVLMDAQMPEMDGIEATRRIRRAQAAGEPGFPPDLRIVAMTANAMSGDRSACLAAGMDDYLAKPVKPDDLRVMLARHLPPPVRIPQPHPACVFAK